MIINRTFTWNDNELLCGGWTPAQYSDEFIPGFGLTVAHHVLDVGVFGSHGNKAVDDIISCGSYLFRSEDGSIKLWPSYGVIARDLRRSVYNRHLIGNIPNWGFYIPINDEVEKIFADAIHDLKRSLIGDPQFQDDRYCQDLINRMVPLMRCGYFAAQTAFSGNSESMRNLFDELENRVHDITCHSNPSQGDILEVKVDTRKLTSEVIFQQVNDNE